MRSAEEITNLIERVLTRSNDRVRKAYKSGDLAPPEIRWISAENAIEFAAKFIFSQPLRKEDARRLLRIVRACTAYPLKLESLADPIYAQALELIITHANSNELAFLWPAFSQSLMHAEQPVMHAFETEVLAEHWSEVVHGLSREKLEVVFSLRKKDGSVSWKLWGGLVKASESASNQEFSELATEWCSALINSGTVPSGNSSASEVAALLEHQPAKLRDLISMPETIGRFVRQFRYSYGASESHGTDILYALIDEVDAKELLRALVDDSSVSAYDILNRLHERHLRLLNRLVQLCPEVVASLVSSFWEGGDEWQSERKSANSILNEYGLKIAPHMKTCLGYEVGMALYEKRLCISTDNVDAALEFLGICGDRRALSTDLVTASDLWLSLRKAAGYKSHRHEHETELAGIRPHVVQLASAHPDLWNETLPWLLARSHHLDGLIEAVTIECARQNSATIEALRRAVECNSVSIRDRASGVLAMFDNTFGTSRSLESVIDFIARYTDGTPILPHPLKPTSRIWLGSHNLELMLVTRIEQAAKRFATKVVAQGRAEEEGLTRILITELEAAFRDTDVSTTALAKTKAGQSPGHISLQERPVPKAEEKNYGCDLALLVSGEVHGRIKFQSCELVQVKKTTIFYTNRESKGRDDNKWKIEVRQLKDHLLTHSQTSVYWLINAQGDVLVVPARMLLALIRGMGGENQGTVDLGYSRVRSMAIPLSQFLVDLLLGGWVGTEDAKALCFARGENFNTKPLHIIEIKVRYDLD
jgi:hypothetical protein